MSLLGQEVFRDCPSLDMFASSAPSDIDIRESVITIYAYSTVDQGPY